MNVNVAQRHAAPSRQLEERGEQEIEGTPLANVFDDCLARDLGRFQPRHRLSAPPATPMSPASHRWLAPAAFVVADNCSGGLLRRSKDGVSRREYVLRQAP